MTKDQKDLLLLCTAIVQWAKNPIELQTPKSAHFWIKDAKRILKRLETELVE